MPSHIKHILSIHRMKYKKRSSTACSYCSYSQNYIHSEQSSRNWHAPV